MRVLHVSTWDVPCGIATYCANLVRSLDDLGIHGDVYPLAPHRWKTFTAGDVADLQADITRQAKRYDLVHFQHEHGLFGHAVSYKAAARNFGTIMKKIQDAGRPSLTTFHTEPLGGHQPGTRLSWHGTVKSWGRRTAWRRHVSRRFTAPQTGTTAMVHTPITRRALIRQGFPATSVHVIPHGCLPQREVRLDSLSAKDRLGLAHETVLLTMFGFVGGYKGHEVAIRALAKLAPHFHLAICGGAHPESDDQTLSQIIRLVRKLRLEQRVTITGWLSEAEAKVYYAATDICLAPYIDTSLSASGAITWALASGKPTIASKIPAFQDICREEPCFLLTSPHMVDEIVWAAEKLAADPHRARQLVAAAGRYTAAHSWKATAAAIHELYASLLAGGSAAADSLGRSRLVVRSEPDQPADSAVVPHITPAHRRVRHEAVA